MPDPVARLNVALGGGTTPMAQLLTPDFVDYIESSCE